MKKIVLTILLILILTPIFISCKDDNTDIFNIIHSKPQIYFPKHQPFVIMQEDNKLVWQTNNFEICYTKIPTYNNPLWFDIVMINDTNTAFVHRKITDKYLFIHTEIQQTKNFSFDSVVQFNSNVKVIYYEGKTIKDNRLNYQKYLTNFVGQLIITENNGQYLSGNLNGSAKDIINNNKHKINVEFNRIPISLVK